MTTYTLKTPRTTVTELATLREALDLVAMHNPERWEVWRGKRRVAMGGVSV